jgi:two-component system LytT family sensor kinase
MKKNKIRFILMIIVGAGIFFFLHLIMPNKQQSPNQLWNLISCIVITFFVWEGNIQIDTSLNKYLSWEDKVKTRILAQLLISTFYTIFTIYFSLYFFNTFICKMPKENQNMFLIPSITIGVFTSFIIISVDLSRQFFFQWKSSIVELEKHKLESTQAQLQNLKNQINPHFLFNNLSVLSSLVYSNQDKAIDFINQLAKVYRYILDNNSSELTTLKEELTFIESYIFLLEIRFSTNIRFELKILPDTLNKKIPPLSLQILIENAIKHNEISDQQPLLIQIKSSQNHILVSNNLQLRRNKEISSQVGLKNIQERYAFFTSEKINIEKNIQSFQVTIPLL